MNPDFWPVVAQVVPVLALALVIEVRAFARQVTKKGRFETSLLDRIVFVILSVTCAALLVTTFAFALGALLAGEESRASPEWAVNSLAFSVGLVVLNPLIPLVHALVADVYPRARVYRSQRRAARAARELRDALEYAARLSRTRFIVRRVELADRYVETMRMLSRADSGSATQRQRGVAILESYLSKLDDYRLSLDRDKESATELLQGGYRLLEEHEASPQGIDLTSIRRRLKELVG
ncbi:hypothetical protein [Microbacterium sp. P05]|uniref:hypothetical protein n=1 Tax=Microbacterium sp. P05 TaxID=3366948 RepID=UPI003746445E